MVTEVVSAAITKSMKNTMAKKLPKAMCEKAIGSVLNTKLGPESGDKPELKSDGKIIKPANTAITVLIRPVITAVLTKFSSLFRWLDKVIITPKPKDRAKNT